MAGPKRDEYAREVLRAGRDLGITPKGIVIGFATVSVECDWFMYANRADPESLKFPHERIGSDSKSSGLFQQQPPWWGTVADRMDPYRSARMFFTELAKLNYNSDSRSPGWFAQAVQKSAFPDRYDQRITEAQQLYDRLVGDGGKHRAPDTAQEVHTVGDPVWLADVLRAEGLKVIEHDGWKNRGHGDFLDVRGVLCHHTAGGGENDWRIVQNGRSDLPGPLAQLVLERDGTFRVIAVGVCWHAGRGSWPGWPTNNANYHVIGIEAVNNGVGQEWPAVQLDAYKRGCAAILRRLGRNSNDCVGHKEYSSEGKIDPFGIDMDAFRRDVQSHIDRRNTGGFLDMLSHEEQVELLDKTRDLHRMLVDPEPSMVDGKPFAAATLIRTADFHAANAHALAREVRDHIKGGGQV